MQKLEKEAELVSAPTMKDVSSQMVSLIFKAYYQGGKDALSDKGFDYGNLLDTLQEDMSLVVDCMSTVIIDRLKDKLVQG